MSGLQCLLTQMVLLSLVILTTSKVASGAVSEIAKPGCQEECGGVKIPFPFGIGPGCYGDPIRDFEVICDNSSGTEVPLIGYNNRAILSISIEDNSLRISTGVAYQCYKDGQGINGASSTGGSYDLFNMRFFNISSTKNMLVGIGCDAAAIVQDGFEFMFRTAGSTVGCITSCSSRQPAESGPCRRGHGCCAVSVSISTMNKPTITAKSEFNYNRTDDGGNNCSAAFITEVVNGSYNFSTGPLMGSPTDYARMRVPVFYEWHLSSSGNCTESMKNGTNLCGSNTRCVDFLGAITGPGYSCQCSDGYTGNPYLANGCQDVNECANSTLNVCEKEAYCVNKKGGYDCKCPNGYTGSATKASPCLPPPNASKAIILAIICSGLGLALSTICCHGFYHFIKKRKKTEQRVLKFKLMLQQNGVAERTKVFTHKELEKATDHFNENRILGQGGQGTVYKGMLTDGTIVAIKRSKLMDESQMEPFINEVVILAQINHRNVVALLGCCLEKEVPLLVYEFVPNGTLSHHIQHPDGDFSLNWTLRLKIAADSAGAIAYLHSSSSTPIYHRDIKSSNILLDVKYKAKVSDFGTSKSIDIDQTHLTTLVRGTMGYLDPEYFESNFFTEKSDVYSFGVVLLELLTGKKPIYRDETTEQKSLVINFLDLMRNSRLYEILDPHVVSGAKEEELMAVADLAKRCLNRSGRLRPTMKEVAMALEMIIKAPNQVHMPDQHDLLHEEFDENVMAEIISDAGHVESSFSSSPLEIDVQPLLHLPVGNARVLH